ncbi:hypothetical protein FIBSPDRAFT_131451 [Athelia psychrophila]|uniref:Carbamoyl phosphate synthase ATP-binding domain-containing protein n=1 Tax=Athelia psychrophila TaxID=1759441 RepID=A0A166CCZ7_9AGAM|nr:hypothetical protein FIBSPDRAFT_131451 [Fibularhizoctonia sp. CBS 109695]
MSAEPERIVDIAKRTQSTHGFLSEGFALASLLSSPTPRLPRRPNGSTRPILRICSPASSPSNGVPVAPGTHVKSAAHVRAFVTDGVGYPAMIRAAGGWGRAQDKSYQTRGRCQGGVQCQLVSQKALSGPGWKHIEVHMGGATGDVAHLCELQCSVQRRFQKLVEMAPFTILPHHK